MSTITITDATRLAKLHSVARGQRKHVLDALVADKAPTAESIMKIAAPRIEKDGTEQTGEYVTRYYLSELRKAGIISGGKVAGARGGAITAILQNKQ